jgi:hypothetical protein
MVLAKDKNEEEAMRWLIKSVHLYQFNWGCWLEMTALISRVEDVRRHSFPGTTADRFKAPSNISAAPAEHSHLYFSSPHFARTLPIDIIPFHRPRSTPLHIPYQPFPPHMSCSASVPYQRLHYSGCSLQQSARSSST